MVSVGLSLLDAVGASVVSGGIPLLATITGSSVKPVLLSKVGVIMSCRGQVGESRRIWEPIGLSVKFSKEGDALT